MTANVLEAVRASIDVAPKIPDMDKAYVNLGPHWPKDLSVNKAYETLLMNGIKIDKRTLSSARDGTLYKSDYVTLLRLRDWARKLTGNAKMTCDDLLTVVDEDDD